MNLVTGATGHIGNVLVRELISQGHKVRALILPGEDCRPIAGLSLEIIEGDVLDIQSLRRAMEGVEVVYHLAGIISIMPGQDSLVQRVNVEGTRNVVRAVGEADIQRLIYTSSIHALSRAPHGITIDETIPFDPQHAISAYDRSKAEASLIVLEAAKGGLDAVIVCPTGVIGPYDYRQSEMGTLILDAMRSKLPLCVEGAYDFVDVRDVASGMILTCERGKSGESYILSGERITIPNLVKTVQWLMGVPAKLLKIPMALARFVAQFTPWYYRLTKTKPRFTTYALATVTSNSVISHAKARRELGYNPRPLCDSLADTIRWFQNNR